MPKVYQFTKQDKTGNVKNVGKMEIKNKSTANAELYIYGDIVGSTWGKWQQEDTCPQDVQDFLNQLEDKQNIDIYVNSGGGDVYGGLAIYNMLKRNKASKTVHVDGLAASAASVIALAGDTVVIPNTAQFMIHNPWVFLFGGYNIDDCQKLVSDLQDCGKTILNVYKENLKDGVDINTIKQMMDDETWMTGEEAAQYFNIQVEETESMAACANSEFFSKYKHTPQNLTRPKPKEPENPQNSNNEILTVLKSIENRLDKLENVNSDSPNNSKSNEEEKQKIANLKAKLALECTL